MTLLYLQQYLFSGIGQLKPLHVIEASRILIILIIQVIVCGLLAGSFLVMIMELDPREMGKIIYAIPVSQFLAVSFVLSVNMLSYKNLKSSKSMTKLSVTVQNTISDLRRRTMSEANTCFHYITAFYILCLLPMFIFSLFGVKQMLSYSWGFHLFIFTQILYMSNTGINSVIVILRTKKLREFYRIKCCS